MPSHVTAAWLGSAPAARNLVELAADRLKVIDDLSPQQLAWANVHGLLGLAAHAIDHQAGAAVFAHFARLEARRGLMESYLRTVLEELADRDIPAAVLKGPFLSRAHYRVPAHRTFSDVDVLVRSDDLERTVAALHELPFIGAAIPEKRAKSDKRDIPVYDVAKGVRFNIDLHWELYNYTQLRQNASGATAEAWSGAKPVESHPLGPLWVLPPEAELAFMCAHAWLDHRFRLILYRDLLEVAVKGEIDWDRFLEYAGRWHLRSVSYVSLLIASRLLTAPIPGAVLEELRVPSAALTAIERLLPRTDFVQFDGHKVHPLNLAAVVLHDDPAVRRRTVLSAPFAYPAWRRRVAHERTLHQAIPEPGSPQSLMLVVSSNRRRGAEVFGEKLGNGLGELGWDVDLVALWAGDETASITADALTDVAPGGRLDPRLIWRLRQRIAARRPAVVLANGGSTLRYTVAALAGMRRRPLLAYASIGEPKYWTRSPRHAAWLRRLHERTDLVLAVSERTRQQLISDIGLAPELVHTARTGVETALFDADPSDHDGPLRVLFLGNLSAEKDPFAAVRVVSGVAETCDVQLRFVGAGPLQAPLEAQVAALGLCNEVEFVGSVDDVRPELRWADTLLLTSKTEGFPGVVLEAAAARVPAVAFAAGGTGETMVDRVSGILIDPGDEAAAIDALVGLARDPMGRRTMGEEAQRLAEEEFTLERSVRRYDTVLRWAVGERIRSRRKA